MKFDLCSEGPWKKPVRIASWARLFLGCFVLALASIPSPAQNVINTVAGGGNPVPGNAPASASLENPYSVVENPNTGDLYVSSIDGDYVYHINPAHTQITVIAGTGYSGYGINGASAPGTSATITSPAGLALDSSGNNLYIADGFYGNHVFLLNLTSGTLTNFAGNAGPTNSSSGLGGFGGDGGPATQAQLNVPSAVAIGPDGTVYIADSANNRIRAVATNGIISTFAGSGNPCQAPPACGDNGPPTGATLTNPSGVAVDTFGDVFIADTLDQEVREVSAGQIFTVAGNGTACNPPGSPCGDGNSATLANLNRPAGLFVDGVGDIYIADSFDAKIRVVGGDGQGISTVVGDGVFGFNGDGIAVSVSLGDAAGVYVDPASGDIYVADTSNNRVREDVGGTLTTIAGGGGTVGSTATGGDNGPALSAVFGVPYMTALDASNNEFIADSSTSRIRKITAGTQVITTVAGSGTAGYSGDGAAATLATLNFPQGVAVDSNGNLFIADTQTDVIRTVQAGIINTFAGTGFVPCFPSTSPCGDGGMGPEALLTAPGAVAVGSGTLAGDVIIADTGDNKIRLVDAVGTISTVAGSGNFCAPSFPLGSPCGDGGSATLADLSSPSSVAVDAAGDIFIADAGDNRIRRVDATTGIITTAAFTGAATFSGDGGPATLATMTNPGQVFVDSAGNLFVGSSFNEVVRRIDAATGTVTTVAGNPAQPLVFGFAGDGGPATAATLSLFGVTVSSTGVLYITDTGNNRIRTVQLGPTSSPTPTKLAIGTQMIGGSSSPTPVTLANTGSDDLIITSITDANEFSETNNCPIKPNVLAPGQTCTINVTFTPTGAGAATDTLIITDNAPGSPHNIPLSGTGSAPFQLSTNCTSLSVVPGQSAIYTVSLAPAQGFTKSVALSCTGVPTLATCTVNPASITLDGATTVQAQVTATTTPPTADLQPPSERTNRLAGLIGLAGIAGLAGLVILPGSRRAKQTWKLWAVLFCLCLVSTMATVSSCGKGLPPDPPGTAAGTYPLTVTATFQSGSGTAFTEKVSFDLVVQ